MGWDFHAEVSYQEMQSRVQSGVPVQHARWMRQVIETTGVPHLRALRFFTLQYKDWRLRAQMIMLNTVFCMNLRGFDEIRKNYAGICMKSKARIR